MPVLALLLIVALVISAVRSPIVRRIGFRNAVRRPREAALVMLGCVLGTALIVGSGSVGDSFTTSIENRAVAKLGPIDARVSYESQEDWAASNARLNASPIKGVQIATAAESLEVPLTSDSSPLPAPRAKLIEVDYRHAGQLTSEAGIPAGTGPTPGTAWVSENLAKHLNLKVDSVLAVHTRVPDQQLRVTKIVTTPLVTFIDGSLDTGDNLLVTPGTIAILQQQDSKALVPRYLTLISGTGPHSATPPTSAAVETLRTRLTELVSPFNGTVAMVRADSLATAKQVGARAGQLLVTIGAFGILAGIMLLINVLLMLAEERLAELGTMRAVGLSRQPLIASFALEGAVYSLVGAALGGLAGIGIGRAMVALAAPAGRAGLRNPEALAIHFSIDRATVVSGVAAGFLVATIVVLLTSWRVSRMDVIRALRGLPDPPRRRRQAATPLLVTGLILGPIISYVGYKAPAAVPFIVGTPIALICLGVLVARRRGYVTGITVACAPNVVWAVVYQVFNHDVDAPPLVTVVGGILIVMSGVLLLNAQQAHFARLVRRIVPGRATVTTRVGLANPIAHRVRMLLTVAPFVLVVFTLVYTEGLSHLLQTEIGKLGPDTGGAYQVFASSSPAHPYNFRKLTATDNTAVAPLSTLIASFVPSTTAGGSTAAQQLWQVSGFDRRLIRHRPPRLVARPEAFASDKAAYAAVAQDADLIIVPTNFLASGRGIGGVKRTRRIVAVGDHFTMFDPASGAGRDVTVAAVSLADVTGAGSFYGQAGAKQLFGARLIHTAAFIATNDDPASFATQLNQAGVDQGVKAVSIADATRTYYRSLSDTVNLYRADLGIGIVVGIAGIGVVLVRSVRDRRRQIGTLRAMGFEAEQIKWSFLIEGAFIAIQGLTVGVGLGFVTVLSLTQGTLITGTLGYKPALSWPSPTTLLLAVGLFGASILASVAPARSASRIPPALALRLVD